MIARRVWTYALVLDRRFWEERPAFLTLLTSRYGIMEARLSWKKGASALVNQGALEPMALSWFELLLFAHGPEATLWESVNIFPRLRATRPRDLLQMALLLKETIPPGEPVPPIFRFALKSLVRADDRPREILPAFVSGLLGILGYGVEELMGGDSELRRALRDRPQEVMPVCNQVLEEVLGVMPWTE